MMIAAKISVYQTAQIREFERVAVERFGMTAEVLMARAGKAALDFMQRRWTNLKCVAVFCGGR